MRMIVLIKLLPYFSSEQGLLGGVGTIQGSEFGIDFKFSSKVSEKSTFYSAGPRYNRKYRLSYCSQQVNIAPTDIFGFCLSSCSCTGARRTND